MDTVSRYRFPILILAAFPCSMVPHFVEALFEFYRSEDVEQ